MGWINPNDVGIGYLKRSIGMYTSGGTTDTKMPLLDHFRENFKIKAVGGVQNLMRFKPNITAGADHVGTSPSVAIVNDCK